MSIFSNSVNSDVPKIDPLPPLMFNFDEIYRFVINPLTITQNVILISILVQKLCRYQFDRLPSPVPGLTHGPLIFSIKIPTPGQLFSAKLRPPGRKNETKIPTHGHNLPSSNAKISMTKEHNSIKAVSFQIFHNCPFDNFLFL